MTTYGEEAFAAVMAISDLVEARGIQTHPVIAHTIHHGEPMLVAYPAAANGTFVYFRLPEDTEEADSGYSAIDGLIA